MGLGTKSAVNDERARILRERVEVAAEQVEHAAPAQLRGLLYYWFGVLFDEGTQMASRADAPTIKMTTARLQQMNERLRKTLGEE